MPPKKRHRRSASVPGGTRPESHIHRYLARHRQSSGLLQPVPVRSNVAGLTQSSVVTPQPVALSGTQDNAPRHTAGQCASHFSSSSLSPVHTSFTQLPLSSFRGIQVPMSTQPLLDCRVESVAGPSASARSRVPFDRHKHAEMFTDTASLQRGQRMTRCHSQPGALLTRISSLKRRRDEYRPWLDFRKMREVINNLQLSLFLAFCVLSYVTNFLYYKSYNCSFRTE